MLVGRTLSRAATQGAARRSTKAACSLRNAAAVREGGRALQYNAALWLQQANLEARVLTFVFYHCRGAGGIAKRRHALEFYGHAPLAVEYWSVGLGDLEVESYAGAENPMAWALAAWMRQPPSGRA